jgi:hypothetical protein
MPTRTQAHEGGTNVTIHIGKQFLILHLEYAFYNALLQGARARATTGQTGVGLNTLYSSGLSSCTIRCDYGLYGTHRTC